MKLKTVGFYQELPHGHRKGPSLSESLSDFEESDEKRIADYLSQGAVFIACPGTIGDVLNSASEFQIAPHILTDGEWAWPSDLPHYLCEYHVRLPREFLEHVRNQKYAISDIKNLDLTALIL